MNCTKCGGSGSEGYLSFLRCGRCGATGQEPEDALVPYSADLIVVPDGPVITALKEEPEVVKKKLEEAKAEPDLGPSQPLMTPPEPTTGTLPPAPPSRQRYTYASSAPYQNYDNSNQTFCNGSHPKEEKEPHVQPISQFFDIPLRHPEHGAAEKFEVNFNFTHLSQDLYSQDVLLHEIGFDSQNKYMIRAFHQGCMILEAFYTGLGVRAVMEGGSRIYPHQEIRFELEPQDKNPALLEDRIAVTVWIEKRADTTIYRPSYPMGSRAPSYG